MKPTRSSPWRKSNTGESSTPQNFGDVTSSDFQASQYDLGATSVRLIRVGNVIQIIFNKKLAAEFYYAEASTRFKSEEEELKRG